MINAGFGSIDITPAPGLLLAGRAAAQRAVGTEGELRARVMIAEGDTARIAIVALDLMALPASEVVYIRERVAGIAGLPPESVMVACSHTHGSPIAHLAGLAHEHEVIPFVDSLIDRVAEATLRAVADVEAVTFTVGHTGTQGWAFNRRPIYANGEVATHGYTFAEGFIRMETEPDETLQVLVVRTGDNRVKGGWVNFACHPTVMESVPVYSSDYAGVLTAELESILGGTFGFLLGASADTANPDPSSPDQDRYFGWGYATTMGRALARLAVNASRYGRTSGSVRIAVANTLLNIAQRRPTPQQVELARWYLEEAPPDIDEAAFIRRLYCHDYTFFEIPPRAGERHAREILGMWEWQRRAGTRSLIDPVEIQAITLGDIAIVAFPVELFTDFGRRLKQESPFTDTYIATQANGWHGYIPTQEAFTRGGYEPFLAYQSRLEQDAGDRMTDAALHLLQSLASRVTESTPNP